jgi:hypothetical protein
MEFRALAGWIPAISVPAVLATLVYFFRAAIKAWLIHGIQHNFDSKFEGIRADLRKQEERFKSELRAKASEIDALRNGALAGMASRQAALDKRRLEAVERIWTSVISLGPLKGASAAMAVINFEAAAKHTVNNPAVRKMFEGMAANIDLAKMGNEAGNERPFLSDTAWALFSAYQAILSFTVVRLKLLQLGVEDAPNLLNSAHIKTIVMTALPEFSDYMEQHAASGYHYLLDALEQKLLAELRRMLAGQEADATSIAQAALILRTANKLNAESTAEAVTSMREAVGP